MKIIPLEEKYMEKSVNLLLKIFNTKPEDKDYPGRWLPGSIDKEKLKQAFEEIGEKLGSWKPWDKYWIAINENEDVIGIIGLYKKQEDENEAYWLGWFAVDEKERGKGIGKKLMNFVIKKSKNDGKKFLRLYTSTDPVEKEAQIFYEKLGLKITKEERIPDDEDKYIYRELRLQ